MKRTPRGCHLCTKEPNTHYALKLSSLIQSTKLKNFKFLLPISPTHYTTISKNRAYNLEMIKLILKNTWISLLPSSHQIAKGTIFQTPRIQLFFILLFQATTTTLTLEGWTQLTPITEWDKSQSEESEETHRQCTRRWSTYSSSSKHIGHILGPLKFLLLSLSFIGILPLDAV